MQPLHWLVMRLPGGREIAYIALCGKFHTQRFAIFLLIEIMELERLRDGKIDGGATDIRVCTKQGAVRGVVVIRSASLSHGSLPNQRC